MGVDKVILRAFLSTFAAIAALILFMFLALVAFFPSTLMKISYNMGMESFSIRCAERAYKNGEDIYYIAYATEVAIEEGKDKKVLSCGEKLIAHENFFFYCDEKGEEKEEYKRFVYGQVCVSKYHLGDTDGAITLAVSSLEEGTFAKGNALTALLIQSLDDKDTDTQKKIAQVLEGLSVNEENQAEWNAAKNLLKSGN